MNKLVGIKLKQANGTWSAEIPFSTNANNVIYKNSISVLDVLGNDIDINIDGSIQEQINKLNTTIRDNVTAWLEENISSEGAILADNSLTIPGQAAEAKTVGDRFAANEEKIGKLLFTKDGTTYLTEFTFRNGSPILKYREEEEE